MVGTSNESVPEMAIDIQWYIFYIIYLSISIHIYI